MKTLFLGGGPSPRGFTKQTTIAAAPSTLFALLTTEDGWRATFDVRSTIELAIGGRFEVLFDEDAPEGQKGSEDCHVLAYVPDRMLAVSWNAPPELPDARRYRTWVVFDLLPADSGTEVRLTHLGFGDGPEWDEAVGYFERAWDIVLRALQRAATAA